MNEYIDKVKLLFFHPTEFFESVSMETEYKPIIYFVLAINFIPSLISILVSSDDLALIGLSLMVATIGFIVFYGNYDNS